VRLEDLAAVVATAGQRLTLDPPEPGATLGGVIAANASGPRRHRYGTARDLLLGLTVVLADGTVAKAGGKVVNNVAGYDLAKLFVGSLGTLGVIAEVTLRLHPLPPAAATVTIRSERPWLDVQAVLTAPVAPAAVELSGGQLAVLFEGTPAAVEAQANRVADLFGPAASAAPSPPAWFGQRPYQDGDIGLRIAHHPAGLATVLAALGPDARVSSHAGVGVTWAAIPAAEAIGGLRAQIAGVDGTAVVVAAPPSVLAGLDAWGPVSGLELMRRVKAEFDPQRRLAPGRFVGGI
jgi:glycolate oxidase FAD binding subunit